MWLLQPKAQTITRSFLAVSAGALVLAMLFKTFWKCSEFTFYLLAKISNLACKFVMKNRVC